MNKIKKFLSGGFGKAIITLISGSLFAQALTIIISPLLTRIYSPEEIGIYTLILTAESLFGSVICGRYDVSIVLERNHKNIYPLIKLSIIVAFISSLLASLIYGSYYFVFNDRYSQYSYAAIIIFLMLFFNGLIRIVESYNNRFKQYKIMTVGYVLRTTIQNLGAISLGFLKFGVFGLLISHTLGMLGGLRKQSQSILPEIRRIYFSRSSELKTVMKKHFRQPIYSTPAMFANRFSYSSIFLFIEALFGLKVLGFYSISYKALGIPLTVMSNNVAKVFFQEASQEYFDTGRFTRSFFKTSMFLFLIAIPMILVLYFFAPFVFKLVFGKEWVEAGVYVQILAPMFGIRFVVNTIANGLQIVKKQKLELFLQFVFILASIGCFVLAEVLMFNVIQYLISISLSFSIVYVMYFIAVMKYSFGK